MAANYASATDFDAVAGGANLRQKLYTVVGGAYSSTQFTRAAQFASAVIQGYASRSGYTVGDSTDDDRVKFATVGYLMIMAMGRSLETLPERLQGAVAFADDIVTGRLPLSGTPSAVGGVGGSKFTGHSTTISTDHPQVFDRDFLEHY